MSLINTIKGKRAVLEAIKAQSNINRIVIDFRSQNDPDIRNISRLAKENRLKIQLISPKEFEQMAPENSQGIIAYVLEKSFLELEDILANPLTFDFILALDHLQDPFNFGAIIRSAEIFGVKAIIFPKDRNAQINAGVVKASSGAIEYMNLCRVTNLSQTLIKLKDNGFWVYGAESKGGIDLDQFTPQKPCVLVVGNEDKGIAPNILTKIDEKIQIPMAGKIESLNVSVATGIMLYKFYRTFEKG